MLAPFVVGADTNLNGANAGPTPGLAPTPPSVTLVWQRHSQTDRAVNKSMRQMLSDEHHHLHRRRRLGSPPGISSSWRIEPPSPPATWTVEECTIGDLVSVRPYRGSFEPVGVAHPVTSHIKPLTAQARPVRTRQHRIRHDTWMLGWPQRPVGAVNVLVLGAQFGDLITVLCSHPPTCSRGRAVRGAPPCAITAARSAGESD